MDRAVLDAYGWTDVFTDCELVLDYEIDEETWSSGKKKPYRYRWPEEVHDDVLARLLALNQERAEEERRLGVAGTAEEKKKASAKGGKRRRKGQHEGQVVLSTPVSFFTETPAGVGHFQRTMARLLFPRRRRRIVDGFGRVKGSRAAHAAARP